MLRGTVRPRARSVSQVRHPDVARLIGGGKRRGIRYVSSISSRVALAGKRSSDKGPLPGETRRQPRGDRAGPLAASTRRAVPPRPVKPDNFLLEVD